MPKTWPASCKTAVKRLCDPLLKFTSELIRTSPDKVLEISGSLGTEIESSAGIHRLRADPDVAEPRIMLRIAGHAERLTTVGHQADIDVRVHSPGLERLQDRALPGSGRLLGVECLEQSAGMRGDRSAIGHEAQGQIACITPGDPEGRGNRSWFQQLDLETACAVSLGKSAS